MIDSLCLLAAITFSLAAFWINRDQWTTVESGSDAGLRCLRKSRGEAIGLNGFGIAVGFVMSVLLKSRGGVSPIDMVAVMFTHSWLMYAGWSDHKYRKVSNRWIIYGFGAGVLFLTIRAVGSPAGWKIVLDGVCGAFLGSGILFAGAMLRPGGIGMGDVKAFFVLGIFFGAETSFAILAVTLVLALLVGGMGIICRKNSRTDRFPLCSFAYVALIVVVLGRL